MLAPETVLQGRYRIIRQLGQGGMGAVYEAMDERLDTTVALKETLFTEERLRKQFEREARLLARMHHPALPRVSDHFSEGNGQFLVMQFIAGDDLAQMMAQKRGPFPADQVLTWGDQLLDALDYLHTQDPQIIHRDIKPQNLKLTGRGQIILLDFGLAKGQAGEVSRLGTTSASIFGYTPNYAPLEQIQGLGTDARSDIYALSATLYHLITGVKPPDALTRAASVINGELDPLRPANEISGSIGPEVSSVLTRGMSQNREQRFATAAAMRSALKATSEHATFAGRSEAATVLFQRPASTLVDPSRTDMKQTATETQETTVVRPPQRCSKRRFARWGVAAGLLLLLGVVFGGFYAYRHRINSAAVAPDNSPGQENSAGAQPTTTENTATEPTAGALTVEENAAISSRRVEPNEPAKKNEKSAKNSEKLAEKPSNADKVAVPTPPQVGVEPLKDTPAHPAVPDVNVPEPGRTGGRRVRRLGDVTIRDFPNGTQVMTTPDGTRVVIFPDGTRRVFRPGERINRRKVLP